MVELAGRLKSLLALLGLGSLILVAGCSGGASTASSGPSFPTPTPGASASAYAVVDTIRCDTTEQVLFHIHSHLAVYVNGTQTLVPMGIGIAQPWQIDRSQGSPFVIGGPCFYWMHTHATDGIIHMESPVRRAFTLGNFFDVWNQPLSANQVSTAQGPLTLYVNGEPSTQDPRQLQLADHMIIQIDVGTNPPPFQPYTWPQGY